MTWYGLVMVYCEMDKALQSTGLSHVRIKNLSRREMKKTMLTIGNVNGVKESSRFRATRTHL